MILNQVFRRILAVVSLAVLWAVPWAILGALVGAYQFSRGGDFAILNPPIWGNPFWMMVSVFAIGFGKGGAVSGALFGIVLAVAERHNSLGHLRLSRVALWGLVAAWLIPGTIVLVNLARDADIASWWLVVEYLAIVGIAGGASATTTLLIARRGPSERGSLTRA